MAFDNRRTYLCYNNRDLIRDGYIKTIIEKEYIPVDTFNINRLKDPPKGVTYIVGREDGEIVSVKERKKQLPASKIKVEIDFSKVMKNAITHPFEPGSLAFTPITGIIATPMMAPLGFGGITQGLTYITFHLLDAETKINYPVIVTQDILDNGIIECDGYPLSVFGIVREKMVEDENGISRSKGLNFTDEQKEVLGKYSDGLWKGTLRKRIAGATDSDGLFGGTADQEVEFNDVRREGQQQLFIEIIKDIRKLKFRGDNFDAYGGKDYPFKLTGKPRIDATDKQIRIKTQDDITGESLFNLGEILYVTYSIATERRVRQNLSHLGKVGQGNTIGIVGFVGAIASETDVWDYKIKTWKVPLLPSGVTMKNVDDIEDYYTSDGDYKLSLSQFLIAYYKEFYEGIDVSNLCDEIEGWRLSEAINTHVKKFWAADYRGIFLYDDGEITIELPADQIRDQEWFTDYLESLSFTKPTGDDDTYLPEDLRKKLEDEIDLKREPGYFFDLSEITNSLLFDREKIPYYRPFANALKNVSAFKVEDDESGVGMMHLDLISVFLDNEGVTLGEEDLELFDLSYTQFSDTSMQPLKTYECEEPFDIHSYNYTSENYDARNEGPGAWYETDYIDNQVFEWRPSGTSIESYWRVETPYFCGDFTKKSRVFIEKMAGNSLDNYSWIFVDTEPFIPHNISLDSNHMTGNSVVVFNDENVHYGLSYHLLNDRVFEYKLSSLQKDITQSHVRKTYNHDDSLVTGQERICGSSVCYSNGIPISDDVVQVCKHPHFDIDFWWDEVLYDTIGTFIPILIPISPFGLFFGGSDVPKLDIPYDWFLKTLTVEFYDIGPPLSSPPLADIGPMTFKDGYVSFYFEGTESSVSNYRVAPATPSSIDSFGQELMQVKIDFNYYNGGPVQFLGEFWNKVIIKRITGRFVSPSHNARNLDLDNYKIKSGQSATIYDGLGRLMVFYANNETGNIDVALSLDDGGEWVFHKNLIRLIEGEIASLPFVIKDFHKDYAHLYYVLNDSFLMYKRINTSFLIYEDESVEYDVPETYELGDYDNTLDDPERAYWGNYSKRGNLLRRLPSFFIAGFYEDPYFVEQLNIRDELHAANLLIPPTESDKKQVPRFEFRGNRLDMIDRFKGEAYSVYMDNEGVLRLFLLSDGKLSIKRSSDFFIWSYDVQEQIIHKTYIDDKLNKGLPEEIHNVQLVRNDYDFNLVSVLYFHNGMLFIRHFYSNSLFPWYDSTGNKQDSQMRRHLEITSETTHRPIFLVGKIPDDIRQEKVDEIDDGISDDESAFFIHFPYDKNTLEKFDERFAIDTDTQVYAYTTSIGLIRIFYKDTFGNLNGIILDSLNNPTLEVMNKLTVEEN